MDSISYSGLKSLRAITQKTVCLAFHGQSNATENVASEEREKIAQRWYTFRYRINEAGNEWSLFLKHQLAQLEHNGLQQQMSHLSAKPRLTHRCCWRKIPETINVQLIIKEDQSNSLINRGLQVYRAFQDAAVMFNERVVPPYTPLRSY